MPENMKGIMKIIAHGMDTSGKKGFPVDRKEVERGEKTNHRTSNGQGTHKQH